mmetsp:Transcript_9169/g.19972  ORF Transcript_9169/g.19972 Transcript_9169/m.19972 type:complete len:261 (+) Transcript_9169:106-888(+)
MPGWCIRVGLLAAAVCAHSSTVVQSGLKVSSLVVAADKSGSRIQLGADGVVGLDAGGDGFRLGTSHTGLRLSRARGIATVDSGVVESPSLSLAGDFSIAGVKQWKLAFSEDFDSTLGAGWSHPDVSRCGGVTMLGGYCKFGRGDVTRNFANLPPHSRLKVKASYHFIDSWMGESGFMKLNVGVAGAPVLVWSERHSQQTEQHGLDLCGNAKVHEGKFSVPLEVIVPHSSGNFTVSFGSTMDAEDPCDESWGVSAFEIYVL